jgi:WD40 repeat protein
MQKTVDGDLGYRLGASRPTEKSVSCLAFAPSGTQLVCGTSGRASAEDDEKGDELLRVIDLQSSKVVESAISGHEDVNLVDFSPCQRYLISGSNTNETAVFDRRHLKRVLHRLRHSSRNDDQGHAGITSALWWQTGYGTSQSMLMTGGGDETVRLWDLRRASEDTEIWNLDTNIGPVARMITPPSMEHLVVGSDTGAVNIYSINDGMVAKYKDKGMILLNDDEA